MSDRFKISLLVTEDETFIHLTYIWNIESIRSFGLKSSRDGLMGDGIYCCRANDRNHSGSE